MDWKSSLEALKQTLPEGEEQKNENTETAESTRPVQNGRLDVILDRKGRKGKEATIVAGFTADDAEVDRIAGMLKKKLGTGGSARGGEILIQGDKRTAVSEALKAMGFTVRVL